MISIICTTHNGRKTKLERAIKSVIAQSYPDWELIVVDDFSQDGTQETMQKYTDKPIGLMDIGEASSPTKYPHDPRINYIRRSENYGCDTKPKNEGILASKGEYIAFLDSDNEYRPDHLAVLMKGAEQYGADITYADRFIIDESSGSPENKGLGICHDFEPFLLMRRNYIDTSDVLIKREALFYVGGFDERYKKYIDWNLWVRMAKGGLSFKHINSVITNYYLDKDTKSNRKEDEIAFNQPAWDAFDVEIHLPYLGTIKTPKVAIFSLTYDRLEYTKTCFESLHRTAGYPFNHFVMDNGSTEPGMSHYLVHESKAYHNYFSDDNKGISKTSNMALDLIGNDYDIIIKVDPDCLFLTDGWLKKMVELWQSNHMLILSPYIQGLKDNPGGAPRLEYGNIKGELLGMTNHVGGIVTFADAKIYKDFRWDEDQPLHGIQDLEFTTYARKHGYQCAYLENYFASHGPSGTEDQKKTYPDYFERRKLEKTQIYETNR